MKTRLDDILSRVTIDTLEKLAFMFAFPEDEEGGGLIDSSIAATISFTGPFTGTLIIGISPRSLPELAANMLGVDDPDKTNQDQQHDALRETTNVICGNLLTGIAGEAAVFEIGLPEVFAKGKGVKGEMAKYEGRKPNSSTTLELEDGRCRLLLFVEGEISKETLLDERE